MRLLARQQLLVHSKAVQPFHMHLAACKSKAPGSVCISMGSGCKKQEGPFDLLRLAFLNIADMLTRMARKRWHNHRLTKDLGDGSSGSFSSSRNIASAAASAALSQCITSTLLAVHVTSVWTEGGVQSMC